MGKSTRGQITIEVRKRWGGRVLAVAVGLVAALALAGMSGLGMSPARAEPSVPAEAAAAVSVKAASNPIGARDTHLSAEQPSLPPPGASEGDYVAKIRSDFTPQNRAYWWTKLLLGFGSQAWSIVWTLVFLFLGFSAGLRDFAGKRAKGRYGRTLIYFAAFSVLGFVLELPLNWLADYQLEHSYGLSDQPLLGWWGDQLKGLAVGIALFAVVPILQLAYWAIGRFRRWWLTLAVGSIPLVVVLTLLQPLVIDPLFNDFVPLKDVALRTRILELAEKAGIPGRNVYEVDKSRQTKKFNAYVNGFGASQRIVLWDTTLKGMDTDEILFVMGHEMGHYRLGHIWKGMAVFSLTGFALFFFAGLFMEWAVRRFGRRFGFTELSDIASLPLFALSISLAGFFLNPVLNGFARSIEHDADTFALEVTHLNDAGARAFIKLGAQNRANPEPPAFVQWYWYSHPALVDRVRYALEYRPWEKGEPNRQYEPVSPASAPSSE